MSTSSVLAFPGPLLSVHRPVAASASFWVYGSSLSCLTLQTSHQYACEAVVATGQGGRANSPPLVRLAAPVGDQGRLGLVPLCALDAVVLAQGGQVFDELGVLVLLEML